MTGIIQILGQLKMTSMTSYDRRNHYHLMHSRSGTIIVKYQILVLWIGIVSCQSCGSLRFTPLINNDGRREGWMDWIVADLVVLSNLKSLPYESKLYHMWTLVVYTPNAYVRKGRKKTSEETNIPAVLLSYNLQTDWAIDWFIHLCIHSFILNEIFQQMYTCFWS